MKKKLIVVIVLVMLFMGACGVPQEDYDTAVEQTALLESSLTGYQIDQQQLEEQLLETEAKLNASTTSLSGLQNQYDDLDIEYRDLDRTTKNTIQTIQSQLELHVCDQQLPDMRYESIMDVSTILQAFISGQEDTLRVSGTYRDTIWSNTQTKIHSIRYRSADDNEMYVDHFLVYFDEFGWGEGVFWISWQCWLDRSQIAR